MVLFTIYRKARYFTIFSGFGVDSLWIASGNGAREWLTRARRDRGEMHGDRGGPDIVAIAGVISYFFFPKHISERVLWSQA
jgi:hypothetical protein